MAKYKSRLLIIAALGLIGIVFEVAKPLGPFNLGAEEARYLRGSELLTSSESR